MTFPKGALCFDRRTTPPNMAFTASPFEVVISISEFPLTSSALPTGSGNEYSLDGRSVKSISKALLRSNSPGVGTLMDCCSAGVNSWMLWAQAPCEKNTVHSNTRTARPNVRLVCPVCRKAVCIVLLGVVCFMRWGVIFSLFQTITSFHCSFRHKCFQD